MGLSALDLTGLTSLFDFGKAIIDRVIPDPAAKLAAQQKLTEMTLNRELAVMANDTKLIELQTSINLEQAKNPSLFVSGPRPALMWVGVFGVAWQWLFLPVGTFIYTSYYGHDLPVKPPELSPDMMIMLGGLMGLQIGFRSYEKVKGTAK